MWQNAFPPQAVTGCVCCSQSVGGLHVQKQAWLTHPGSLRGVTGPGLGTGLGRLREQRPVTLPRGTQRQTTRSDRKFTGDWFLRPPNGRLPNCLDLLPALGHLSSPPRPKPLQMTVILYCLGKNGKGKSSVLMCSTQMKKFSQLFFRSKMIESTDAEPSRLYSCQG